MDDSQNLDFVALKLIAILFQKGLINAEIYQQVLSRYSA